MDLPQPNRKWMQPLKQTNFNKSLNEPPTCRETPSNELLSSWTQCCVMVRVKVFRQHPCAKFFPALELELFEGVKWVGLSFYSKRQNAQRERLLSRELLSERGTMRNEQWCLLLFFFNLLHTTRAVTKPRSIQSKHAEAEVLRHLRAQFKQHWHTTWSTYPSLTQRWHFNTAERLH